MKHSRFRFTPFLLAAAMLALLPTPHSHAATTTRVSISSEGDPGNNHSGNYFRPDISGDGRYVAFSSDASNLVANDTNSRRDIFLHDRQTGETTRVSVNSSGIEGNGDSDSPAITPDARFVAFRSTAMNLVAGDANYRIDIFVHDRQTGQTTMVSVNSDGTQGNEYSANPSISDDGRYVAFESPSNTLDTSLNDSNNAGDVFLHDRQTGNTSLISKNHVGNTPGNKASYYPAISGDGSCIAFTSGATGLTGNSDTNNAVDIFVRDLQTQTNSLVSSTPGNSSGNNNSYLPAPSRNCRTIAFESLASNLVNDDSNGDYDIFVRDRDTNQTTRVSYDTNGSERASGSRYPDISANGRFLSYFIFNNTTLQFEAFFTDRQTGKTALVSVNNAGIGGNADSFYSAISADGNYVAFDSTSSNLMDNDITGYQNVYVRGPFTTTDFPWPMFLPAITGKK